MKTPRLAVALFLALFRTENVSACEDIHAANESLLERLELQKQIMSGFEEALNSEINRCQSESSRVSSKSAQLASAESCVALKENAAMNRELKNISGGCAKKFAQLEIGMNAVRAEIFIPFQSSIDLVVKDDQGDPEIQGLCPSQINDTADLAGRTEKLLNRSKNFSARADDHYEKFRALRIQTEQFEQVTQAGYDRCTAEQQPILASPAGSPSQPSAGPTPSGNKPNRGSSITGVEEDKAKRERAK